MRPVVNVSVAPAVIGARPAGYSAVLGAIFAIGVLAAVIVGLVPGAERSAAPSGLEVTSASAISID
jgi:hypothetical protein